MPPTAWLMAVAAAAPSIPHLNTAQNNPSRTIFVPQPITVESSPNFGRSAVTKKIWLSIWTIKNTTVERSTLPYIIESDKSSPSAPIRMQILGKKMNAGIATSNPRAIGKIYIRVNVFFAFSVSPSPSMAATSALPPLPNIKPMEPMIMIIG